MLHNIINCFPIIVRESIADTTRVQSVLLRPQACKFCVSVPITSSICVCNSMCPAQNYTHQSGYQLERHQDNNTVLGSRPGECQGLRVQTKTAQLSQCPDESWQSLKVRTEVIVMLKVQTNTISLFKVLLRLWGPDRDNGIVSWSRLRL